MPLTHREFARKYVVMPPDGPKGGQRYRDEWQPVLGLLWDELDKNIWQEVAVTGPAQASKSFGALVVPTLRDVIALEVSPIVGVPEADMFADKWQKDFKPVVEASPALRQMLPEKGSGARDGRVRDMVTFTNSQSIKVMSRGGKATNKAGFTSQRLRITEAAGFSEASQSETDHEADSYRQLVARLGAFDFMDPRRLVLIEGTGTIAEHLPWRLRGGDENDETLVSSKSRLVSPCPHCEAWISLEREHLVGWNGARTANEAYERARFLCPGCGTPIDDDQRRRSMADVKLVHFGQEITPAGEIVGAHPAVPRLWFRWSAWHNCLVNAGSTAVAEWEAAQEEEGTVERENAERDLCQKKWAIPFKSSLADNEPLSAKVVRKRTDEWQKNLLPADTVKLEIGVDVGDWTAWWVAVAFRENGQLHVPAYGAFDVKRQDDDELATRIIRSLSEFNESTVLSGFPVEGSDGLRLPDGVGVDIGHMPDEVCAAVRTFGRGWSNRWKPMRGRGGSRRQVGKNNGGYNHPIQVTQARPLVGNQWFAELNVHRRLFEVTFNADYWLLHMQDRLRATPGGKGALTLYKKDMPNEHDRVSNHWTAEQLERSWDPTKGGLVEKWVKNGQNHLGDALKMALVLGDIHGYKLRDIAESVPEQVPESGTSTPPSDFYARLMQ